MYFSPPHTFGPASPDNLRPIQTRAEQIDPWHNHAKSCTDCRRALGRLHKTMFGAYFYLAWSSVRRSIAGILASSAILFVMNRGVRIIEGERKPSRVTDRSVASH